MNNLAAINHLTACRNVWETHYMHCMACRKLVCDHGAAAIDEYLIALQRVAESKDSLVPFTVLATKVCVPVHVNDNSVFMRKQAD